jgi:hypothetical protein
MSVAPQVLSTTYHYAKRILTACIIRMGVKKHPGYIPLWLSY